MRASEFITEEEVISVNLPSNAKAKAWIQKVYELYPYTFDRNHVMAWNNDEEFVMFELTPSMTKKDAVEVKWFQAYPMGKGIGQRGMAELQKLAREDGIVLTLFPWDKGQVSRSKLKKFYGKQGFKPVSKGATSMFWEPEKEINESDGLSYIGNCTDDDVIEELFGDATTFAQLVDEYGDEFVKGRLIVKYDADNDIHNFYKKDRILNELNIDNNKGWGQVPKNTDVDYFGIRTEMRPSMFLKLSTPMPMDADDRKSIDDMKAHEEKGGAFAAPFLEISVPNEWRDGDFSTGTPKVTDHDGRHRMAAHLELYGDTPVETHIFLSSPSREWRTRYITPEIANQLKTGGVISQRGQLIPTI